MDPYEYTIDYIFGIVTNLSDTAITSTAIGNKKRLEKKNYSIIVDIFSILETVTLNQEKKQSMSVTRKNKKSVNYVKNRVRLLSECILLQHGHLYIGYSVKISFSRFVVSRALKNVEFYVV